ncbi:hypothetical protein HCN44_008628 [Aphidius gifuensis]|uniref:Homeobox domain-containing protein n=1 Tax=Aphidius gifuensis TaxID=684658 RepID=A0A835CMM6_APHGI|nr:homeotic protein caudal [Aphidius gifuensis]KAF7989954.1 hypothetical protein HCN44_008628 [Aphidius gifuensis]
MVTMSSFFNPLAIYCQPQTQTGNQQFNQQLQHLSPPHPTQEQPTASAMASIGRTIEIDQQCWYGYPHPHHHHHNHHHQHLQSVPEEHHSDVIMWQPHAHAYSHLHRQHHSITYQHHPEHPTPNGTIVWSEDRGNNNLAVDTSELSPPITASESEISYPSTPLSPIKNNNIPHVSSYNKNNNNNDDNNNNVNNTRNSFVSSNPVRPTQMRSPYEWLKKTSYQNQLIPGKTRTKDKYRVVYTDYQRVELEKEFHYNKYINIKRKAELSVNLGLSERQVKIWFQNRRAKNRKQIKKRLELEQKGIKLDPGGPKSEIVACSVPEGSEEVLNRCVYQNDSPNFKTPAHSMPYGQSLLQPHMYQHTHLNKLLGL